MKTTLVVSALLVLTANVATAQMPITKVVVVEARSMEAPATITLVGTVEPIRRSRIASELAGLVAQMPVRQGDFVAVDGTLCQLKDDVLTLQLAEAESQLGALQARHQELLAGTRAEDLRRLKSLVDATEADVERWRFEIARVRELYAGSDSNAKELYDTRADALRANLRQIAAQADYDLAVKGPRSEVIAKAAYDVAAQKAVVDRIANDLRKTTVHPPFAGHVVQRTVEVGEWIPVGGQIVEMVDLSSVLVRVDAPESAIRYLTIGTPVRVLFDALGRSLGGAIKHVVRQADPTARTFPVEIEIDNSDGELASGMFARASVPSGPKATVVAVPKDAIVERNGTAHVAMTMPGRKGGMVGMLLPVTVGADVGDWIAITSGNVRPGMSLITRGNERVRPFPTPVQIVDENGTPVPMPDGTSPAGHAGASHSEGHGGERRGGAKHGGKQRDEEHD